jgi:hypothetical protein
MSTTRAAAYFLGVVLLVVAAIAIGRQFEGGEPVDWLGPCLLGAGGALLLGMGIFLPLRSESFDF